MKLKRYRVFDFRSIKDSNWIECDEVTTLVGINESGKSNLLLALWKLNPVRSGEIDILHDIPVYELSELRNKTKDIKFISAEFSLEEKDENIIKEQFECESLKDAIFSVTRFYDGHYNVMLDNRELNTYKQRIEDNSLNKEETQAEKKEDEKLYELLVKQLMPKFVYYSNYGNLSSKIYLPNAVTWLDGQTVQGIEKNDEQIRTLRILFKYVNLSPNEILNLGKDAIDIANPSDTYRNNKPNETQIEKAEKNKEERSILIQAASNKLTRDFKNWWKQGSYKFRFEADGDYFTIWVSDEKRTAEVDLGLRSTGLQWFLSFYLTFLVESEEAHENAILLLDEAGLTLHPLAQKDLVYFFNSLSKKGQIINTTHSPFIIDTDNMDRCKVVYSDENGFTVVSNDLRSNKKTNEESIYAVHAALGLTVSDVLLQGCTVVIVEGVSDQHYLNGVKNYLIKNNYIHPGKELVFVPSGGVKNITSISSIIGGKKSEIPYIIIDSDKSGLDLRRKLESNLYLDQEVKILEVGDFVEIENSEIEDFISYSVIKKSLKKLLRGYDDEFEDIYDNKQPLINQIEEFCKDYEIPLKSGWKVELSKLTKKELQDSKISVPEEVVENWKGLFHKLQLDNND